MAQTPARKYQAGGQTIDYTPGSAVAAGQVVILNGLFCAAPLAIAANELGALDICGDHWEFPKVTGAILQGAPVYWDADADPVAGTAGSGAAKGDAVGNTLIGFAAEAAASGDEYVKTALTPGSRSVTPLVPTATVAATGTIQGDAAPVAAGFTLVTGADAATGVKLPDAPAGTIVELKNGAGAALKVWPFLGDGINAIAVNSNYSMAANTSASFRKYDGTTWYSTPLVAS